MYQPFAVLTRPCLHKWHIVPVRNFHIQHQFLQTWKPRKLPGYFYLLSCKGKSSKQREGKTHHQWSQVLLYLPFSGFFESKSLHYYCRNNWKQHTAWKMSLFGVILVRVFPYSFQMRENTDQKNSEYGYFSRSDIQLFAIFGWLNNVMTEYHSKFTKMIKDDIWQFP